MNLQYNIYLLMLKPLFHLFLSQGYYSYNLLFLLIYLLSPLLGVLAKFT